MSLQRQHGQDSDVMMVSERCVQTVSVASRGVYLVAPRQRRQLFVPLHWGLRHSRQLWIEMDKPFVKGSCTSMNTRLGLYRVHIPQFHPSLTDGKGRGRKGCSKGWKTR